MRTPEPVVLARGDVRLEPLAPSHVRGLTGAVDHAGWTWLSTTPPDSEPAMAAWVQAALAEPARQPWVVLLGGRVVGSTSYLDIDVPLGGLEVGWTWYAPSVWATEVNPTCKLLLLGYAFDELGASRVLLKTDAVNTRSRGAIARLGASLDGVLRHHRLRPDGSVRDTACYSVLTGEWPAVRDGLLSRLVG